MKTKKDILFAVAITVFAVTAVALTLWGGFNLGATVSCALFFVLSSVYVAGAGHKPDLFSVSCGFLALAGSLVYTFSADHIFRLAGLVLIPLLLTAFTVGLGGNARHWSGGYTYGIDIFRTMFILPFSRIDVAMKSLFSCAPEKSGKKTANILIGLAASLPVLVLVVPLLIRADAAFSGFIQSLFDRFDLSRFFGEIVLGLMIAPLLFTVCFVLRYRLDQPRQKAARQAGTPFRISSTAVISFLSAIVFFYVLYLFTQLAYFFNGFSGILPEGWNVVTYAKRGFFEMCAIAAINFCLVCGAAVAVRRKEDRTLPVPVKILNLFISLFTLLLIATALAKMVMYIRNFGMTRARLLTSLFMCFLAIVYIAVIIRLFAQRFPYMKVSIVAAALCFVLPWILTPVQYDLNSIVCRYNTTAYQKGTLPDLDVEYLAALGESAIPYLIEIAEDSRIPARYSETAASMLTAKAAYWHEAFSGLRAYNYSRAASRDLLRDWARRHDIAFGVKYETLDSVLKTCDP